VSHEVWYFYTTDLPLSLSVTATGTGLSGTLACEALGPDMPLVNPTAGGGLLTFVTKTADGSDRLLFRLHRSAQGLEGYACTWGWDDRRRAKVRLRRME
jgi:hypothetical protein